MHVLYVEVPFSEERHEYPELVASHNHLCDLMDNVDYRQGVPIGNFTLDSETPLNKPA